MALGHICCYADLRYNKGMSRQECWSCASDKLTRSIWMDSTNQFWHASFRLKLWEERHYHLVEDSLLLNWNLAWLVLSTVASYRSPVIHPEIEIWKSVIRFESYEHKNLQSQSDTILICFTLRVSSWGELAFSVAFPKIPLPATYCICLATRRDYFVDWREDMSRKQQDMWSGLTNNPMIIFKVWETVVF